MNLFLKTSITFRRVIWYFSINLLSLTAFSQSDSLQLKLKTTKADTARVELMVEIGKTLLYSDPDSAFKYAEKGLTLAQDCHYSSGISHTLNLMGMVKTIQGDFTSAIQHYEKAISIDQQENNLKNLTGSYGNLSIVYQHSGDYYKALDYELKSLKISKQLNDHKNISVSYNNIGIIYYHLQNPERAKSYFQSSINYGIDVLSERRMAQYYANLADAMYDLQKKDSARLLYDKALEMSKINNAPNVYIHTLSSLGKIAYQEGDYHLAIDNHQKALKASEDNNFHYIQYALYANIADDYIGLNKTDSSKYYLQLIFKNSQNQKKHLLDAYESMTRVYIQEKNSDSADFYLQKMIALKDTLLNNQQLQISEELQIQYNTEQLKGKLTAVNLEKERSDRTVERRTLWLYIILSILIFGTLTIILFLRQRKAKINQRLAEFEQRALRAQMNPHFIFNSLNSIQRLYVEGEMSNANDYMADFSTLLRKILENSSHHKISLKEELDMLEKYCTLELLRSGDSFEYKLIIDDRIDILHFTLPPLIMQPFVENAIWHGLLPKNSHGKVIIELTYISPEEILCSISDNGVGWDTSQPGQDSSKGIKITEQRLKTTVQVYHLNPGTKIEFTITKT